MYNRLKRFFTKQLPPVSHESLSPHEVEQAFRKKGWDGITQWTDVYVSPKGPGYVRVFEVTLRGGDVYQKRMNVGPEEHWSHDWKKVERMP